MRRTLARHWRLALLLGLVGVGVALAVLQPVEREQLMAWGDRLAGSPWSPALLIVAQVLLFALGMPGTLMLWVIAPFFSLLAASTLLLAGSVAGAATAYLVAVWLGRPLADAPSRRRVLHILARRGDFLTQCALRVLPGFPHSAVNFAGGLLRLPLLPFLAAAGLGLAVKWPIYVYAVQGLITAEREVTVATALPLLLLAAFLGVGVWARGRFGARAQRGDDNN